MMVFLPLDLTHDNERFEPQGGKWEVAYCASIFHAPGSEPTEVVAMASRTIWRVWYGRRLGIQQSFEDISNFGGPRTDRIAAPQTAASYSVANFAACVSIVAFPRSCFDWRHLVDLG